MDILNKAKTGKKERPIKVVQFGEGNFLRGFVDYMIDIANEQGKFDGDIVLIKPIEFGNLDMFHKQDCQYTVSLRGNVNGEAKIINRIVTSVADAVDTYNEYDKYMGLAEIDTLRFVVSNTTEAGIVYDDTDKFELEPPKTFPGKLTKFLYHRFETFQAPASSASATLSRLMPPSTSRSVASPLSVIIFRITATLSRHSGISFCPPKPGSTVITSTISTSSR